MKRLLLFICILGLAASSFAQNLPTKWNCKTNGSEVEKRACVQLYDQFVASGFTDMIAADEYPAAWFRIDVISQELPERKVFTMNLTIMMAYPLKFGNLLISVYTQAMSVGSEAVDNPLIYEVIVDDVKRDVGAWAENVGDFIDFCPNSGREWYKQQEDDSTT